jgi:2-polyprenyl-3-methyl-5-hydroxy-6-metoxy-1,4-benzoquinol methylase
MKTKSRSRRTLSRPKSRRAAPARKIKKPKGPTPERLMQMAWGYAPPLIIEAAVKSKVFDVLDQGAKTVEQLAAATGASPRGLRAILDALVAFNFAARKGNRYSLTPESAAFLVSTKPGYHGGIFNMMSAQMIPGWLRLSEAVRSGKPVVSVNDNSEGEEFFVELVTSLFPLGYKASRVLGEHLGVPKAKAAISVLDLGAGSGVWGIGLAHLSPHVTIRAVDWPKVLAVTKSTAQRHGVGDRLTTAAGDLLEADFGANHNIATIGHILHSEGPERSRQLLRKTFAALAPGGTVAIAEFLPNEERTGPPSALIFAVNMMLHTDVGDTFTFNEIAGWLREAGFVKPRLLEAPAPSPLILATRP